MIIPVVSLFVQFAHLPFRALLDDSKYFRVRPLTTFDGGRYGEVILGATLADEVKKRWKNTTKRTRQRKAIQLTRPRPDDQTVELLETSDKSARIIGVWLDFSNELLAIDQAKEEIGPGAVMLYEPGRRQESVLVHWPERGILLFCREGDVEEGIIGPTDWIRRLLSLPTITTPEPVRIPASSGIQIGSLTLEPTQNQQIVSSIALEKLKSRIELPTLTVIPGASGSLVMRVGGIRGTTSVSYLDNNKKLKFREVPCITLEATCSVDGTGPYEAVHISDTKSQTIRLDGAESESLESRVASAIDVLVTSLTVSVNHQLTLQIEDQSPATWTRRQWERRIASARGELR